MFPRCLERAVHPAISLANKSAQSIGRFGQTGSFVFVCDRVTKLTNCHRKVRVFGKRKMSETSRSDDQLATPCADRARYYGDAVEQVERATVEILTRDVLERLPSSQKVYSIADFCVAGNSSDSPICEV